MNGLIAPYDIVAEAHARPVPLTHDERRKIIETPFHFNVYGSKGHACGGRMLADSYDEDANRPSDNNHN